MGFNFPNAPTLGQKFPSPTIAGQPVWQWDGSAWKALGAPGLGGIYVSDTAPAGAPDNSLWWESDTGNLYIRYNDGDSSQWVIVVPSTALAGIVRFDVSQSLTAAQQTQGRQNIAAAPLDALAYSGMQVNGSMDVSQENGSNASSVTNNGKKYIVDGWYFGTGPGQTLTLIPDTSTAPMGLAANITAVVTAANTSPAAGEYASIQTLIEGYRIIRLGFGTASASPLTIGFWVWAIRTGTYSGSICNNGGTRSYAFTFAVNTTQTWEYKTVTIPGDTAGTWTKDNTVGMAVRFCMMVGTTYQTAAGSWAAGNFLGATGSINGVAATSDIFRITGVVVLPGVEAPSAARSPLIMRPYDQELLTCMRYYAKFIGAPGPYTSFGTGIGVSATQGSAYVKYPVRMRGPPTGGYGGAIAMWNGTTFFPVTSLAMLYTGLDSGMFQPGCSGGGLTAGAALQLCANNDANAFLSFDARL